MTCSAESNDESELVCFCKTVPKTNKTPLNYYKVEINVSNKIGISNHFKQSLVSIYTRFIL